MNEPMCQHCAAGRHDRCPDGRTVGTPCGCMARDAAAHDDCPIGHFPTGTRVRTSTHREGTIRKTMDGPWGIEWCVWFDDATPGSGLSAVRPDEIADVSPEGSRGAETWFPLPIVGHAATQGAAS